MMKAVAKRFTSRRFHEVTLDDAPQEMKSLDLMRDIYWRGIREDSCIKPCLMGR